MSGINSIPTTQNVFSLAIQDYVKKTTLTLVALDNSRRRLSSSQDPTSEEVCQALDNSIAQARSNLVLLDRTRHMGVDVYDESRELVST